MSVTAFAEEPSSSDDVGVSAQSAVLAATDEEETSSICINLGQSLGAGEENSTEETSEEDTAETESESTEPEETESSSETTTAEETSSTEESTKETTTKETTTKETTTKETTTKETTTKERTTKETTTKETTTKETTTKETTTSDETSSEETSSEATSDETSSSETTTEETSSDETTTEEKTTKKDKDKDKEEETEEETTEAMPTSGLDRYEDIGVVVNDKPEKFGTLFWPLPAEYTTASISSRYGYRTGEYSGMHRGLDIAAPSGTPIYACDDGVVIASYFSDSAGNFTIIQHDGGIYTEYMHQSVRYVKAGDKVKAGQLIGLVGNTGWSTGPHLHIGVVVSDTGYDITKRVDPLPYLTTDTSMQFGSADPVKDIKEEDLLIEYKDGKKFTDRVNARTDLTERLYPLVTSSDIKSTTFSGFTYKGYIGSEGDKLKEKNAVTMAVEPGFNLLENTWIRYEAGDYDIVFTLEAVYNSTEEEVPVSVRLDNMTVLMDWSACRKSDITEPFYEEISEDEGAYFAVDVHVDVFEHGTKTRISEREIYQMLKDVDEGQTFRCLNEAYDPAALFVENTKKFNKNNNKNDHGVYLTDKGDIYSDYALDPYSEFESSAVSNTYRQTKKLGQEGLELVFGFEHKAEANISFYVPKRTVMFRTTEGGKCDTIGEVVNKRGNITTIPSTDADEGYEFKGWVTDQNVELSGGGTISAGNTITEDQIKDVTVMDRLSFTAVFEKTK